MTMELVARVQLSSLSSFIDLNSIPQDGTDLLILLSARDDSSSIGSKAVIWPNGSSSSGFQTSILGNGSSTSATYFTATGSEMAAVLNGNDSTGSTFSNSSIRILNYASTSLRKAMLIHGVAENNATQSVQLISGAYWNSTSAITSVRIVANFGQFVSGTSATLYKITKGSTPGVSVS